MKSGKDSLHLISFWHLLELNLPACYQPSNATWIEEMIGYYLKKVGVYEVGGHGN